MFTRRDGSDNSIEDLSNIRFTDAELDLLIKRLNTEPRKTTLILSSAKITAAGVAKLRNLRFVKALNLSGNPISDEGAKLLAEMSFNCLELKSCKIGPIGHFAFLNNRSLYKLNMILNGDWVRDYQVSSDEIKEMLTAANIVVDTVVLDGALNGDREAAMQLYHFLNINYKKGIVLEKAFQGNFTETQIIENVKVNLLKWLYAIWQGMIVTQLENNKESNSWIYAVELPQSRRQEQLEKTVMTSDEHAFFRSLAAQQFASLGASIATTTAAATTITTFAVGTKRDGKDLAPQAIDNKRLSSISDALTALFNRDQQRLTTQDAVASTTDTELSADDMETYSSQSTSLKKK